MSALNGTEPRRPATAESLPSSEVMAHGIATALRKTVVPAPVADRAITQTAVGKGTAPLKPPPVGDTVVRLQFQLRQAEEAAAQTTDETTRAEHLDRAHRLRLQLDEAKAEAEFTALAKSVDISAILAEELSPIAEAVEALSGRLARLE